ncbi:MAG: fasciclin domain-containing protein [Bacteroidia bacterium]
MKKLLQSLPIVAGVLFFTSCGTSESGSSENHNRSTHEHAGQSAVPDDESARNVVQVAVSSADHSTLVAAVKAAGLVDALSNVGPFTVFAPVNAAFDELPAGTVESLLKPESKSTLIDILEYHVYVGVIRPAIYQDGMRLNQVNGGNVTLGRNGADKTVNNAKVLGTVEASNGIIYVIDKVLLPE